MINSYFDEGLKQKEKTFFKGNRGKILETEIERKQKREVKRNEARVKDKESMSVGEKVRK